MEMNNLYKIYVKTGNNCFLCCGKIASLTSKTKYCSIQNIFRYLKINLEEFYANKSSDNTNEFQVKLCNECEGIVKSFSEYYKIMEMTRMKLDHNLERIQKRLKIRNINPKSSTADNFKTENNFKLVEELRLKINEKCEMKINKFLPRIEFKKDITTGHKVSSSSQELSNELANREIFSMNPAPELIVKAELGPEDNPKDFEALEAQRDPLTVFHDESEEAVNDIEPLPPAQPKTVEDLNKCPICNKTFAYKSTTQRHILRHSSVPDFKCNICQEAFHFKGELHRHMLRHTGEKHFQCPFCPKRFSVKRYLNQHVKDVHNKSLTPGGIKRFRCNHCGKIFKKKISVEEHIGKRRCQTTKTYIIFPPKSNSGVQSVSGSSITSWHVTGSSN